MLRRLVSRDTIIAAMTLCGLGLVNFFIINLPFLYSQTPSEDLIVFVEAAKKLVGGDDPYALKPFAYPPQSIVFWLPFTVIEDELVITHLFYAINVALIIYSIFITNSIVRAGSSGFFLLSSIFFASGFVHHNLTHGQSDFLLMSLILTFVYLIEKDKVNLAAVPLFFSTIVKLPQVGLLLALTLLVRKHFLSIIVATLCLAFSTSMVFTIYGPAIFSRYIEKLGEWLDWQGGYAVFDIYQNKPAYFIFVSLTVMLHLILVLKTRGKIIVTSSIAVCLSLLIMPFTPSHQIVLLLPFLFLTYFHNERKENIGLLFFMLVVYLIALQPLLFTGRRLSIIAALVFILWCSNEVRLLTHKLVKSFLSTARHLIQHLGFLFDNVHRLIQGIG